MQASSTAAVGTVAATPGPAEIYDARFVPALFRQWGPVVTALAGIKPGDTVLDVACGTGALTLAAAEAAGPTGRAVGLDPNPEMLDVARRKDTRVEWHEGRAEALPIGANAFDAVVSQFGLMFFEDRPLALRERMRVLKPGGRLAVAVCDAVERSPGYAAFARLLERLFGNEVADAFRSPFVLGDRRLLLDIAAEAGIDGADVVRRDGEVRFASIADLVSTERACAWTLGGLLDEPAFERLRQESESALADFAAADGRIAFTMPALILTAVKPR
jgi:SAM-dependent methyltransferase